MRALGTILSAPRLATMCVGLIASALFAAAQPSPSATPAPASQPVPAAHLVPAARSRRLGNEARGEASAASAATVRSVIERQVAAWNRGDLEGFMATYWASPELTFFSGATITQGWQATLDRYRRRYQAEGRSMGRLEFSELRVEMLGARAAFVRGRWRLHQPDGKPPNGVFTVVLRQFGDGWKIIHDHTSAAE